MTVGAIASPPAEVVIGIDVGTTASKAVAFGVGVPWRHSALHEYPLLQPHPGWEVQDPERIRAAVLATVAQCVGTAAGAHVVGLSISTAMHGLLGLDADLRPVTPLVTWADSRSVEQSRALRASGIARQIYRASGTPVHPMTPLTKIMWFTSHQPDLSARVRHWVGLKDYIVFTLTGTLATELSSASGTAMLDVKTRQWNPAAIELAGIEAGQLPEILATTAVLPLAVDVAQQVGLPAGTPVVLGAGDGPLGNLGTGATAPGIVGLSIGTSGAARMLVPEPVIDPEGRLFCYALTDRHWVAGSAVSNGGVVARWAAAVFGQDLLQTAGPGRSADAELLSLAAQVPAGSDGLLMLPYLLAERGPLWDPDLSGAFLGIRHGHTRGHFVRAAVEGVALQLSAIVDRLDSIEPVTSVRATGGVFRSQVWRDVVAGALGRPIRVVGGAEGTALGAAALGLFALGRTSDPFGAVALLDPAAVGQAWLGVEAAAVAADASVYARMRAQVPALLDAYDDVARLFASMEGR